MTLNKSKVAEIGEKLKEIREEQGISQKTVMIRTGLAQKTISRTEHGKDAVKLETVIKMAEALGMKLELVKGEEWKREEETG